MFRILTANIITTMEITMNKRVYKSGFRKSIVNTRTVVMSVTNVAANNILAKLASGRSVSNRTEYTTAREVVESAIPAIKAACRFQPAIKYVKSDAPIKGARNEKDY